MKDKQHAYSTVTPESESSDEGFTAAMENLVSTSNDKRGWNQWKQSFNRGRSQEFLQAERGTGDAVGGEARGAGGVHEMLPAAYVP